MPYRILPASKDHKDQYTESNPVPSRLLKLREDGENKISY